ncbi:Cross-pathway control 1 [Fusarium tjaetaba]|uniref:Cross-pathway control protein 1 n=1 Tax=Fusarium tjaetaba TaxID=1567544 RepID=A0A8H5RJ95_9HYPO|nr:Cross-pathway control 1 [Fusarium tjaetaba]KAF5633502.1 Cross-pathway control 1 [Fusarium tjaetaba]
MFQLQNAPWHSVVVLVMVEAWCLCAGCAVSELVALKKSASPIKDLNASIPTQPPRSAHLSVDLNSSPALNSFSSSSLTTANISSQDFPVFTTDPQSPWLPSTNSSLPAQSAQQLQSPESPQLDFVLFDQPQPPNRSTISLQSQRRHSSHLHNRHQQPVSPAAQNQRVAQLLQAFGHSSSPVNRPTNQFYASSAPSSSTALNKQNRPARPPVPLFSQSTGSVPQQTAKMMNAADVELPEEFTAFDGGANTAFSSPAVPSVFDFGGSSSSSIGNLATISPQDLFAHDNFMSAPNSSALTALTSPSIYNESPEFDGYDVSPNFGSADFDGAADPWFPLFPQDNNVAPAQPNSVENSPELKSDEVDSDSQSPAPSRRKSGTSPSTRHSSVAGVNARKRDKPLPPIVIDDPSDIVAMKRARNTLAARKSRERKAAKLEELEEKIAKLEAERDHWKRIALAQTGMQ